MIATPITIKSSANKSSRYPSGRNAPDSIIFITTK